MIVYRGQKRDDRLRTTKPCVSFERRKKKEEGEEENRGRPSRAKDLQTGREKVEKNSANNRRRKIEGADERLQSDARRGLDTGVGMERVSCVHHRDFLL